MTSTRSTKSKGFTTEEVTSETPQIESPKEDTGKEPVNLEVTASEEPKKPEEAKPAEEIQTDVRQKLAKKSVEENVFVPANPVALEKAAGLVAQEQGFELNRGTSIGARLIARSQKKV